MEEEARVILSRPLACEDEGARPSTGLGERMAALFAEAGLDEPIAEWRGDFAPTAPSRFSRWDDGDHALVFTHC